MAGTANIHVKVLASGNAADHGWVVIGTSNGGGWGHIIATGDSPGVQVAFLVSGCSSVWPPDGKCLVVKPKLTDVAVTLKI